MELLLIVILLMIVAAVIIRRRVSGKRPNSPEVPGNDGE
jgi:hypothetical protein